MGPEERALEATGSARLDFGAPASFSADLRAKQLDVDALLRGKNEDSVSPSRALTALARALAPLNGEGGAPLALRVAFATPAAIVGAQTLSDVAIEATAARGAPLAGSLRLGLPGRSTLNLSGTLDLGAAAQFKGRLEARVGDFTRLSAWAAKDEPELGRRLTAIAEAAPYREASAAADVEASAVGFSARDLTLTLDRTALGGAMAFTRAIGGERGRLYMDLRSDLLDVDALPNLRASADLIGDVDLKLALEAAKLRVARVGEASVEGGSLSLKMTKTAGELWLDRLSVAGLGGATVEARGAARPQGRWLIVRLDADKLRDFAALAARIAPGRVARCFPRSRRRPFAGEDDFRGARLGIGSDRRRRPRCGAGRRRGGADPLHADRAARARAGARRRRPHARSAGRRRAAAAVRPEGAGRAERGGARRRRGERRRAAPSTPLHVIADDLAGAAASRRRPRATTRRSCSAPRR